jgi:hypothetical protein
MAVLGRNVAGFVIAQQRPTPSTFRLPVVFPPQILILMMTMILRICMSHSRGGGISHLSRSLTLQSTFPNGNGPIPLPVVIGTTRRKLTCSLRTWQYDDTFYTCKDHVLYYWSLQANVRKRHYSKELYCPSFLELSIVNQANSAWRLWHERHWQTLFALEYCPHHSELDPVSYANSNTRNRHGFIGIRHRASVNMDLE